MKQPTFPALEPMATATTQKKRRVLTEEQTRIQEESRSLVKILGLMDGLSGPSLDQIIECATRKRAMPPVMAAPPSEA